MVSRTGIKAIVFAFGMFAVLLAQTAMANEARFVAGGTLYTVPVKSLEALKFQSVIRQGYDFSCGSAALATLLTFHYNRPVTEEEVFDAMWAVGDKENIRAKGFSLLDMKTYLESIGIKADGFRVPLDKLAGVGVPTIALIVRKGYAHFVVLRGIHKDYVVLGDPSLGAIIEPRDLFEQQWNGIAFALHNEAAVGREHFNLKRDLPLQARAFLGMALPRRTLENITVLMKGEREF
jgi:predicted double-glycine peptidase